MTESQQSFTYHSLYRHVQSILPQYENKDYPIIYSSNKQPQLPSVLQRSRQKKSHQKSLKKGISRVSKSKKDLMQNTSHQTKEIDTGKSLSKGTILNFNLQQVVENRYHLARPKNDIIQKSPVPIKQRQEQKIQKGSFESNEKSFISQYRIVTYVPQGYNEQKNVQKLEKSENLTITKQLFWDKENNLNQSNLQKQNHIKNDSESVQIIDPVHEHILQLETWRTSQNFDQYYINNVNTEMLKSNITKNENPHASFQQKYSIPLTLNVEEIAERNSNAEGLKEKIRHLEHEIVDIEKQKCSLIKENQVLKRQNEYLNVQHKKMRQKQESVYQTISTLQEKVRFQNQEIKGYQQQLDLISKTSQKLSNSELYLQKQAKKDEKIKQIENLTTKISKLQILNTTLSKQLSQKNLWVNELNIRDREISDKLGEMEKALKRSDDKLQDKQGQLLRKIQIINELEREIETLRQSLDNERNKIAQKYHSLPNINSRSQSLHSDYNLLKQNLQELRQKYEQQIRDYNHLQKKHNFMKDQLEHLKYLQSNGSSSYRSLSNNQNHNSIKNYELNQLPNGTKSSQYDQYISELQTRLEITERHLKEIEEQYSNLKQNFRALQELYIKQQQQTDEIEQEITNFSQENKRLKIELANQQEIFKAKTIKLQEENQSISLMKKEEIIITLKRELNSLEKHKLELEDSQNYLSEELQALNEKYLKEVEKNTQFSIRYKDDLALFTQDIQKQEQEKTSLIVLNYENLISKLNKQISFLKDQVESIKDKNLKELIKIQDLHKNELQQLKNDRFQRLYAQKDIKSYEYDFREDLKEQGEAKKQLQKLNARLQQQCNILDINCKKLQMQKQIIEKELVQSISKMKLYEEDILYYKEQKEKFIKEKLQLSNQLEKVNEISLQLKKMNCSFDEQKLILERKAEEWLVKYTCCMKENQILMQEVRNLTNKLSEKQVETDSFDASLRELRIALLQEKQNTEKKLSVLENLKEQCENHRSKEEYYKMMYEKTAQQLEFSKQQNSQLLLECQKKSIRQSPIKGLSTMKKSFFNDQVITTEFPKERETQLYRIQIYKDLNRLMNLTLQNFTLQQILQKNEQEYLRKLFNAIKEDHDRLLELKQLIIDMEEGFKQEKVHIKQNYDLVYEKYLKYKSMCQVMEKDIQRYKLKLKKKDENFASIKI